MEQISNLESRIAKIEERNRKVELDKMWEKSWTRRALLILFTYGAVLLYFMAVGIESPFVSAVVPTVGFLCSTLTLSWFKKVWERRQK